MGIKILQKQLGRTGCIYYKIEHTKFFVTNKIYWVRIDVDETFNIRGVTDEGKIFSSSVSLVDPRYYHGENKSFALDLRSAIYDYQESLGKNSDENRARRFWDYK
jgi:hypothetical protein